MDVIHTVPFQMCLVGPSDLCRAESTSGGCRTSDLTLGVMQASQSTEVFIKQRPLPRESTGYMGGHETLPGLKQVLDLNGVTVKGKDHH